jgi:prepilin-type processing-associated H-X9-DG protein
VVTWRRDNTLAGDPDFPWPDVPYGNGHSPYGTIYRLKEGIERFAITDINNPAGSAMAQSDLAVMWDSTWTDYSISTFNHVPGGANVLYMDGHVEFMRYPNEEHPCTAANLYDIY